MTSQSERAARSDWALARLTDGGGEGAPVRRRRRSGPAAGELSRAASEPELATVSALAQRFRLTNPERTALLLALAVEESPVVGRAARALTGARGLTAELLEERVGPGLLAADGRLRAHALLWVDCLPAGLPGAHDGVRLAPGVRQHLAGAPPDPAGLGLGLEAQGPLDRGPVPEALGSLVRDEFLGDAARWVAISGLGGEEVLRVAAACARRIGRPALMVDGELVARLAAAEAFVLLSAARREADLADTLLVVRAAAALGGLLRALSAPATSAVRVLLADPGRVPEVRTPTGFAGRRVTLLPSVPSGAAAGGGEVGPPAGPAPVPTVTEAIQAARQQAALDAARAMGRPIEPVGAATTPAIRSGLGPAGDAGSSEGQRPVAITPAAAKDRSPMTAAAAAAPAAAVPTGAGAAPSAGVADLAATSFKDLTPEQRLQRAASYVGTGVPAGRREQARRPAPPPPPAVPAAAPALPSEAPPSPAVAAPAEAVEAATAGEAPGSTPAAAAPPPYLPLGDDSPLSEVLRVLRETPSPLQRAAILRQLADAGVRDVGFVAQVRAHLKSEHPAVLGAAEYAMVRIFGPTWNRARAIPRPVQPARPDDEPTG